MEEPKLASQLSYLEEKYQEAQSTIARLQQRVEGQAYQLQEQQRQIEALELDLNQSKSDLKQFPQLDEQFKAFKEEMLQLVEQRASRYQPPSPDAQRNLLTQQLESHTQALNQLRRQVDKTEQYDEQIALARAEAGRLHKEISQFELRLETITKQLEERTRPLTYLEEQRQTDARKIAEVQAELPKLQKKIDGNLTKVKLVEQQIPQFGKYEVALDSIRDEMRRYREHIDFQLAQRERQIKDWTAVAEATERRIRENEQMMEKYTEFYQLNKRALTSLQDLQERLQRDQHRLGELQRLSEERQRAEIEKFQADFEQRWQRQSMEFQPQFEDFQKSVSALQQRIEEALKLHHNLEEQMNMVLQIIEEDVEARMAAVADWRQRFEAIADGQAG